MTQIGVMGEPSTLAAQYRDARRRYGDSPALLVNGDWWNGERIGCAADAATVALHRLGAREGSRIVLALPNSPAMRVLEQAVITAGMVRVALTPRLHAQEIAAITADCAAAVVCCAPDDAARLRAAVTVPVLTLDLESEVLESPTPPVASAGPGPDEIAMLLYSSGTTGRPKGAQVSHRAWQVQAALTSALLGGVGAGDVVLAVAPMPHFGGSIEIDCTSRGAAVVTMPRFDRIETLEAVVEHGVTVLPLAPIMLTDLAGAPSDLVAAAAASLRSIPYGGSPIAPERLLVAARAFPGLLRQLYGLSETLAPVTTLDATAHDEAVRRYDSGDREAALHSLASAGCPVPPSEVRLRSESGADVTSSATASLAGEVMVRGPMVSEGYWGRGHLIDDGGWFATGDLGWFDSDGALHLCGRSNDLIVSGGLNVYPAEVERALRRVPWVTDVAVVGRPHERWGESVHAVVVPGPGPVPTDPLAELVDATRKALARYKAPRGLTLTPALPLTPLGKVDRRALRADLAERSQIAGTRPGSGSHVSTVSMSNTISEID